MLIAQPPSLFQLFSKTTALLGGKALFKEKLPLDSLNKQQTRSICISVGKIQGTGDRGKDDREERNSFFP